MATSPDYVRLATSATRALADTALDSLRDAVVVVDTRHKHFPVILANAAARRCLTTDSDAFTVIESPLHRWLADEPATTVAIAMAELSDLRSPSRRVLVWRFLDGETSVATEIKPLSTAPGQRLVMLTFAPVTPEPRLQVAKENLHHPGGDATSALAVSEMRRANDLLAETQRAAQMGGWEYSYVTRELTWTDEMYRIYDTSPREFSVSWDSMLARCTPESLRRFHEACDRAEAAAGPLDLELEVITLKQQRLWIRLIGQLQWLDGRPFRAFGSVQNVQAQKLAQIALQTSTGWLKLSMNMAHMHAWRWDRTQDMLEFAIVDGQKVHLPSVFPGMKKFMARVHPPTAWPSAAPSTRLCSISGSSRRNFGSNRGAAVTAGTRPSRARDSTAARCRAAWWGSSKTSPRGASRICACSAPRSCCASPPRMRRTPSCWSIPT
jgi:hypothetical protein